MILGVQLISGKHRDYYHDNRHDIFDGPNSPDDHELHHYLLANNFQDSNHRKRVHKLTIETKGYAYQTIELSRKRRDTNSTSDTTAKPVAAAAVPALTAPAATAVQPVATNAVRTGRTYGNNQMNRRSYNMTRTRTWRRANVTRTARLY
ncbi:unnamed protein product, partial [Medioppia subpectinata]